MNPLPQAQVAHVMHRPHQNAGHIRDERQDFAPHVVGKTDAQGRLSIPVSAGKWRLHTIHMERAAGSDVDWESVWTTLTFEVS